MLYPDIHNTISSHDVVQLTISSSTMSLIPISEFVSVLQKGGSGLSLISTKPQI